MSFSRFCLVTSLCLSFQALVMVMVMAEDLRTWTSNDGVSISARLKTIQGDQVLLELSDGKTALVPLTRLSPADRAFIKQNQSSGKNNTWPDSVEVSSRSIEVSVLEENLAERRYVYHSELFQFTSQEKLSVSVMKELARTFEATHALVKALPWSIDPVPPKDLNYYQAKFYASRRNYILDGGPENSGGVYFSGDRIFRVPFESLGLEMRGKTWFKNEAFENDTVIHEITHQMMHDSLPFLPMWLIEGSADYTKMLPYNAGRFLAGSHERGIKEYIRDYRESSGLSLSEMHNLLGHMSVTREQWQKESLQSPENAHRLYYISTLLVYYFCHLDGDGQGARFIQYMEKIKEARAAWAAFMANPQVKPQPDGSFIYPTSLPLPTQEMSEKYGINHLDILLNGRTAAQLDEEIKTAYRKIGIK